MDAYRQSAQDVLESLSRADGLTEHEVKTRRARDGDNVLPSFHQPSFLELFVRQFRGFLVWLLIAIAIFAVATGMFTGESEEYLDAIVIGLIVVINATLGAYQDYKAERYSQTLREQLETKVHVRRDGTSESIDSSELVIGDVVILSEGDQVPADARVIHAFRFTVDESSLTGESTPSEKRADAITTEVSLAERSNMVYCGSFVRTGTATCVVVDTGGSTEIGAIASVQPHVKRSRFLTEVDTAARQITRIALPLIAVALVVFYSYSDSWVDLVMLGSALIVGSIPEGLPAIVTFSLSISSLELSKRGTLVKHTPALETLGSIDVLCTDKTGTLTENRMRVVDIHTFGGEDPDSLPDALDEDLRICSLVANEARESSTGFIGAPEDVALIDHYNHVGTDIIELRASNATKHLEPFSSENKRMHVVLEDGRVYEKGAPEELLPELTMVLASRRSKLTQEKRDSITSFMKKRSAQGKRLIVLVRTDPEPTYLATFALEDPPRAGASETIRDLWAAGVTVKMITGDSLETAKSVARECGFPDTVGVTWNELRDLSEQELLETVDSCSIFARMSPSDKLTIVKALQARGHSVGITGDGVNDVPALEQADIGVSMMHASDIAKDASDLIILDGDLTHVLDGIKSGRTVFDNMRKVINYLLTANLSEIIVVFLASLFGLVPFTAIQLLWVNFVTDIGPALALGADPAHPNVLKRRPNGANESLIDRKIMLHTVFIGLKKVAFLLAAFIVAYQMSGSLVFAQTITFTWLVLSHISRIVAIRVDEGLSIFANRWLILAMGVPIALQVLILYTPLASFFQIVPIPGAWWLLLIGVTGLAVFFAAAISYAINQVSGGFIVDRAAK